MGLSSLRVEKKKSKKHKIKIELKKSLKTFVNYLKSNSYMYSPLLSSGFSPRNPIFTTTGGGLKETKEALRENKLVKKVGDYLKSDSYMYAPLTILPQTSSLSSHPSKSTTGGAQYSKETALSASKAKIAEKTNLPLKQTENQQAGSYSSPRSTVVRHTLSYRETVKHMIPQNCRSTSVSGFSSHDLLE